MMDAKDLIKMNELQEDLNLYKLQTKALKKENEVLKNRVHELEHIFAQCNFEQLSEELTWMRDKLDEKLDQIISFILSEDGYTISNLKNIISMQQEQINRFQKTVSELRHDDTSGVNVFPY
jgi:phage shock protein A